jgi:predicted permease
LLGIGGGALGLILALWANQLLLSYVKSTPLAALEFGLDYRVLAFTFVVSVVTGIIFGLAPALQASRLNLVTALKSEDPLQVPGAHRSRLRNAFVTVQVMLSVVLLVGSGLFIRALQRASSIDPGFNAERALTVPINLGLLRYGEIEGQGFYRDLLEKVRTQPGVEQATLVRFPQLGLSFAQYQIFPEGSSETTEGISVGFNVIGPNFFKTMGTPLLRGREFTEADRKGAPGTVVINETLAARLWPGEDALGRRISLSGSEGPFLEVVGVARDSKYRSLGETPRPYVYQPLLQSYDPNMTLVVRTMGEPRAITPVVREQIRALEPNLPIADVKTFRDQLELSLFPSRIAAWTLGGFGLLALLLAAIGIYGVVSYAAAQRTREIGVRMALGAKQRDVLGLVLWDGAIATGVGLAVGLLLAAAATRVLAGFLYGVGATDPLTFIGVPLVLGLVAFVASYIPARRATKLDPLVALRYE